MLRCESKALSVSIAVAVSNKPLYKFSKTIRRKSINSHGISSGKLIFNSFVKLHKILHEVLYFANEKGIYFGFKNFKPPERQTPIQHKRDAWMADGDRNFIIIDFVGNGNNGYSFGTSLGDSVGDGTVSNENQFIKMNQITSNSKQNLSMMFEFMVSIFD